ncbi:MULTISPECIES: class E sortase [Streptacidiphilus]|uniref:Class E sortase n=1 Tax=Streptacidiphilus cavernicola TaxID=3342716 RepID=A0ABV6USI4_9ACTN|nr:class E sortase [Streptacidiphilus jeojiense]
MSAPPLDRPAVTAPPAPPEPPAVPATAADPAPVRPRRPPATPGRRRLLRTATAVSLLGFLLVGFAVFLLAFAGLQEQHFQSTSYKSFALDLGNAVAPTGSAPDGAPVAVIDIPAIGLHSTVVVEGTTGRDLMRGPGHRRDTALPGQQGVSVLYGRTVTFGAPFGAITSLRTGDKIYATTGQGRFSYTVDAFGDGSHPITDTAASRLVLVTGNSSWIPTGTTTVGARLDGTAAPNPGGRPAVVAQDKALASDDYGLAPLQLWSLALLGAVLLVTLGSRLWHRQAAYLAGAPVVLALLWSVYENAAALLPNLY